MDFNNLLFNFTLLLSLCVIYNLCIRRWKPGTLIHSVVSGLVFGGLVIIEILFGSFEQAPGLYLDGRAVVLSLAGLFGGPLTACIAVLISALFRIVLGGSGLWLGLAIIYYSAAMGVGFYYYRRRNPDFMHPLALAGFGMLVHFGLLVLVMVIPGVSFSEMFPKLATPVLLLHPLATVLISMLLIDQERISRATGALKESEARFRRLTENAQDTIYRIRVWPKQRFEYINRTITGYTPADFYNDPKILYKIVHPDDWQLLKDAFNEKIPIDKPLVLRWVHKEGWTIWTEHRIIPIADKSGRVVAVEGISRDITNHKQQEEQLRRQTGILLSLISEGVWVKKDLQSAVATITEACAELVQTGRVGVWRCNQDFTKVTCFDLYERDKKRHLAGIQLVSESFPGYVKEHLEGKVVNAEDVYTDPRTKYINVDYFQANGIYSILDIPVWMDDRVGALLRFEQVGEKRTWSEDDTRVATTMATLVSLCFEAFERRQVEEALRQAHERLDQIIEFLPDPTFVIDCEGRVTAWNRSIEEITGLRKEEIIGKGDYEYAVPFYHDRRPILIDLALMPEENYRNITRTYDNIRIEGDTFYGETFVPGAYRGRGAYLWASASKLRDPAGNVLGAIETLRDISERKEYEEKLKYLSMHDQLTGLYNRAFFEEELKRLEYSRDYPITIISTDVDGLKLINDTMGHDYGDILLQECARILKESVRRSDILARVGGDEFVLIMPRTPSETAEEIASRIRNRVVAYNDSGTKLHLSVSIGIATAEHQSVSLDQTYKKADDLMYRDKLYRSISARGKIVRTLLVALSERDFITEGHARRLTELCQAVGEKVGLPSKQLSDLSLLAQVHDLGKVGIPDQVLLKPGLLTEEEWEIMRQHSEKGYRIAISSPDLVNIAELILKHHERWDGCGYPLGLRGEDIPIECRILAIADAYDAMTTDRPYRKAMKPEAALLELERCAGTQFDPHLVQVFLSIIKQARV